MFDFRYNYVFSKKCGNDEKLWFNVLYCLFYKTCTENVFGGFCGEKCLSKVFCSDDTNKHPKDKANCKKPTTFGGFRSKLYSLKQQKIYCKAVYNT